MLFLLLHNEDTYSPVESEVMKVPCQQLALMCRTRELAILEEDSSAVKTQMSVAPAHILASPHDSS